MNLLRMINPTQPYAWGSKTFIQKLLSDKSRKPIAELWIGAHHSKPSQILNGDKLISLNVMLANDPQLFMGEKTHRVYGAELPFLLKVLAADNPLSVQAHPNQAQAKAGFTRENQAGINPTSPLRNYKDSHHKPELIVALTPLTALCGFRPADTLTLYLKRYLWHCDLPSLNTYLVNPSPLTLNVFYKELMHLQGQAKASLINNYLRKIMLLKPETRQEVLLRKWSKKLAKLYPGDIGILSPLLLNIFDLRPFQSLYLEAGVLHAYLKGAGMEIMANSDNVLRGGLTAKHVDVAELLNVLTFSDKPQLLTKNTRISNSEYLYPTPAKEFALSFIKHKTKLQTYLQPSGSAEIIFCYDGSFEIENCSQILTLNRGQSLFVPYETEGYTIHGKGLLFRARCNL